MKRGIITVLVMAVWISGLSATGTKEGAGEAGSSGVRTLIAYWSAVNDHEKKPDLQMVIDEVGKRVGFNIDARILARDTYGDKMNLLFASGEKLDLFHTEGSGANWNEWAARGALQPMTGYLEEYGPNITRFVGDGFYGCVDKDGEIWSIPKYVANARGATPTLRVDWYREFTGGTELPVSLEELEAYFEFVKNNDLNGNGNPDDEIPFLPQKTSNLSMLTGIFTGQPPHDKYMAGDGTLKPMVTHPHYIDYLDRMRDWYSKGYIYREFFVLQDPQRDDLVSNNRVGMMANWYSRYVRPAIVLQQTVPEADFALLPTIQSPASDVDSCWNAGNPWAPVITIPKAGENPDLTVKLLDWIYTDKDNFQVGFSGIEGVHWVWKDKNKGIYESIALDRYTEWPLFPTMNHPDIMYTQYVTKESNPVVYEYGVCTQEMFMPDKNYKTQFDLGVSYDLIGTPAEGVGADGNTMIDEALTKYIMGSISRDDWYKTVDSYMKIAGDILSEVWTEQYNSFKN